MPTIETRKWPPYILVEMFGIGKSFSRNYCSVFLSKRSRKILQSSSTVVVLVLVVAVVVDLEKVHVVG